MDSTTEDTKKCANPECNDPAMAGSDKCEKCAPAAEEATAEAMAPEGEAAAM